MSESHWHEWRVERVILVRDQQMSNGSRPAEVKYKRCIRCKAVLF